ncbi:MAG TPA: nuclear transport factor 2 family protein [Candidatus Krumholzibacteria bacterium]|nr:nuclear transport factor 2 family protein [Candidatus Krumholzibacteria bacterium]
MITRARARTWLALTTIFVLTVTASAEHHDHEKDIEQAVLNYANALYDMKPELIVESVSPKLQKVGYMPARDGSGLVEDWMTFEQLEELAGHLNENGMFDPATSPRDVTILHYTDMIATVKLDAAWGVDYIHLSRNSGKWMIMNVIWEMPAA